MDNRVNVDLVVKRRWWFPWGFRVGLALVMIGLVDEETVGRWLAEHGLAMSLRPRAGGGGG